MTFRKHKLVVMTFAVLMSSAVTQAADSISHTTYEPLLPAQQTVQPHIAVGRLKISYLQVGGGMVSNACTASVINAANDSTIMTAGHCFNLPAGVALAVHQPWCSSFPDSTRALPPPTGYGTFETCPSPISNPGTTNTQRTWTQPSASSARAVGHSSNR